MKISAPYLFFKRPPLVKIPTKKINCYPSSCSRLNFIQPRQSSPAILKGIFNYNEAFATFVKGTRQKQDTAAIVAFFINKLRDKQVSLSKPIPANVLDIGCADSKTCLQYLKNINHPSGFNYFGIDTNQQFINEANKILSTDPIVKKHTLVQGDALSGKLNQMKEFDFAKFDLIFASHIAYYIKNESSCRAFLADIIRLLSEQCGTAIFFHENSTYYFRSTYNKDNFHTISTPMLLEKSAQGLPANFNQFSSITFKSKLQFLPLREDLWEATKHPEIYKNYAHEPNFINTLEKLAFVVQRDLIALAEEGCLAKFIDEIKEAITANNDCLDLKTNMQTIVSPECKLRHIIAKSLDETLAEIPKIINQDQDEKLVFRM